MTSEEWKVICGNVTDAMSCHTRPFVTPLSTSSDHQVRLVGNGSYVTINGDRILVTCKHVARTVPMEYRFYGCESVFRCPIAFTMEHHRIDAAFAPITDQAWTQAAHQAAAIPYERFAARHHVVQCEELLFFRGYAGENARYGFGVHEANGSGYCSQEKKTSQSDSQIFEIFWERENTQFSAGTSAEGRAGVKFDDPAGFSGSFVWNTRYLEVTNAGKSWLPEDAVVSGMLRRYDPDTGTLLVLRVEQLRDWVEKYL